VTEPQNAATGTSPHPSKRARLRRALWITAGGTLLFAGYHLHTATKRLGLRDGRQFDLLQYDRNTLALYDPKTGEWEREQRLLVKYYSDRGDRDNMVAEARTLAPVFFPIADSLGLRILLLEPSRPLFTRSFPILITSWNVRFVHDSSGKWKEQS
jgi:hypothetical protein